MRGTEQEFLSLCMESRPALYIDSYAISSISISHSGLVVVSHSYPKSLICSLSNTNPVHNAQHPFLAGFSLRSVFILFISYCMASYS